MSAIAYLTPEAGAQFLVSSNGNQCALLIDTHSPCQMEMMGLAPDADTCPLIKEIRLTARIIDDHTKGTE